MLQILKSYLCLGLISVGHFSNIFPQPYTVRLRRLGRCFIKCEIHLAQQWPNIWNTGPIYEIQRTYSTVTYSTKKVVQDGKSLYIFNLSNVNASIQKLNPETLLYKWADYNNREILCWHFSFQESSSQTNANCSSYLSQTLSRIALNAASAKAKLLATDDIPVDTIDDENCITKNIKGSLQKKVLHR